VGGDGVMGSPWNEEDLGTWRGLHLVIVQTRGEIVEIAPRFGLSGVTPRRLHPKLVFLG